jgi:hypothetical protein
MSGYTRPLVAAVTSGLSLTQLIITTTTTTINARILSHQAEVWTHDIPDTKGSVPHNCDTRKILCSQRFGPNSTGQRLLLTYKHHCLNITKIGMDWQIWVNLMKVHSTDLEMLSIDRETLWIWLAYFFSLYFTMNTPEVDPTGFYFQHPNVIWLESLAVSYPQNCCWWP